MESTIEFKRFYNLLGLLKCASTGKVEHEADIARVLKDEYSVIYKEEETSSIVLIKEVLFSLSSNILSGYHSDLRDAPGLIPEGLEGTLLTLKDKTRVDVEEFPKTYNDGIPLEYLKNIFLTELGNKLIDLSELIGQLRTSFFMNWEQFNRALENATETPITESFYLNRVNELNNIQMIYQTLEIIMLANYEEIPEMEHQIDAVDTHLDAEFTTLGNSLAGLEDYWRNPAAIEPEPLLVGGMEGFVCGVMSCYDIDPRSVQGNEAGFVDSIKKGLSKTGETIMGMLRSIKDFFLNRKKDAIGQMEDIRKNMEEQLGKLKKEDASKFEINTENVGKMKTMLEEAGLTDEASYFSSVNSLTELITALEKTMSKLETRKSEMAEAEKAIAEAEQKANEATKEPTNLKEDSSKEEKKLIKDQMAEYAKAAKEAVTAANEKVKKSFIYVRAAAKVQSLYGQLFKKKGGEAPAPESVTGNESWLY